jgi:capsular exopolysaccharide synthesis family protein
MADSITRALELARAANKGKLKSMRSPQGEHWLSGAKPVAVSASVMAANRLISALPDRRIIDCYSLLRARLLHRVRPRNLKAIGVTSPSAKDGKSLTATNLAISIAAGQTYSVLLVDADIRRPSVAELFGLEVTAGLGDYLAGEATIEELLLRPPIDGLALLPERQDSAAGPDLLTSDRMFQLIMDLKQKASGAIIIFDLPPALVGGDVAALAPNLDALLLVVADRRTSEAALQKTIPLLEGSNVIGTVLNYADDVMSSYDYYGGR